MTKQLERRPLLARMLVALGTVALLSTAMASLSVQRAEAASGWECCLNWEDGWCDGARCSGGDCNEEPGDTCEYNGCCTWAPEE